jgi:hypothetical protein
MDAKLLAGMGDGFNSDEAVGDMVTWLCSKARVLGAEVPQRSSKLRKALNKHVVRSGRQQRRGAGVCGRAWLLHGWPLTVPAVLAPQIWQARKDLQKPAEKMDAKKVEVTLQDGRKSNAVVFMSLSELLKYLIEDQGIMGKQQCFLPAANGQLMLPRYAQREGSGAMQGV